MTSSQILSLRARLAEVEKRERDLREQNVSLSEMNAKLSNMLMTEKKLSQQLHSRFVQGEWDHATRVKELENKIRLERADHIGKLQERQLEYNSRARQLESANAAKVNQLEEKVTSAFTKVKGEVAENTNLPRNELIESENSPLTSKQGNKRLKIGGTPKIGGQPIGPRKVTKTGFHGPSSWDSWRAKHAAEKQQAEGQKPGNNDASGNNLKRALED